MLHDETGVKDEALLAISIQSHISRMWRSAEKSAGSDVRGFYLEDGEFCIEGHIHAKGHVELQKIGASREQIGGRGLARHSRHIMSNYDFDFGRYAQTGMVDVLAVMLHFGGSGATPLPLDPPIGLYDVKAAVARQPASSGSPPMRVVRTRAARHCAAARPRTAS